MEWPDKVNLTLGELMKATGWSKDLVRQLREAGVIRAWRLSARMNWRYNKASCQAVAEREGDVLNHGGHGVLE